MHHLPSNVDSSRGHSSLGRRTHKPHFPQNGSAQRNRKVFALETLRWVCLTLGPCRFPLKPQKKKVDRPAHVPPPSPGLAASFSGRRAARGARRLRSCALRRAGKRGGGGRSMTPRALFATNPFNNSPKGKERRGGGRLQWFVAWWCG